MKRLLKFLTIATLGMFFGFWIDKPVHTTTTVTHTVEVAVPGPERVRYVHPELPAACTELIDNIHDVIDNISGWQHATAPGEELINRMIAALALHDTNEMNSVMTDVYAMQREESPYIQQIITDMDDMQRLSASCNKENN